jgi:hypothetical protein
MRRSFVTVGLALVGALVSAKTLTAAPLAQDPAAPAQQQTAAPAAPDPLKFTTNDAAIVVQVAPGKSADFESGYSELMQKLAASTKPELQTLGQSMKVYKVAAEAPAGSPTIYLIHITNASHDLSYNYGLLIYYSGKPAGAAYDGLYEKQEDATVLYTKLKDAIAQINPWPLAKIGG